MMVVWPWVFLERESSWIWSLRTISSQCHNNPVFVPPLKPPDHVKDLYDGQTYDLKSMDVVKVEYGTFAQTFQSSCSFLVYYWYYLLVVLCDVTYYFYAVVDWSLEKIEDL